jgi:hypothetical protein
VEGSIGKAFGGPKKHLPEGTEEKQVEKLKAYEDLLSLQVILAKLSGTFERN